jgi:hypothetical protein
MHCFTHHTHLSATNVESKLQNVRAQRFYLKFAMRALATTHRPIILYNYSDRLEQQIANTDVTICLNDAKLFFESFL